MQTPESNDLRSEYKLSELKVVARGPGRTKSYSVELAADVAKVFPTAEAVNEALRFLIRVAKT